jgi:hypothetical protein
VAPKTQMSRIVVSGGPSKRKNSAPGCRIRHPQCISDWTDGQRKWLCKWVHFGIAATYWHESWHSGFRNTSQAFLVLAEGSIAYPQSTNAALPEHSALPRATYEFLVRIFPCRREYRKAVFVRQGQLGLPFGLFTPKGSIRCIARLSHSECPPNSKASNPGG